MIFTGRFVYVREPKTGGTFVTHVRRAARAHDAPPAAPRSPPRAGILDNAAALQYNLSTLSAT